MTTVAGLDGCRGGWVLAVVEARRRELRLRELRVIRALTDLDRAGRMACIGIDIPMGLPERGTRDADREAKAALGERRSSVFWTPTRAALAEPTRAAADVVNRAHDAGGLSAQSFGLFAKIREADAWVRTSRDRVVEVHPEVSFTKLLGHPARFGKKTTAGIFERMEALQAVGLDPLAARELDCAPDDALDAVVAAWSAWRAAEGTAQAYPRERVLDATGLPMQILA
ncbi:DUF429 domain-containing protein [Tersicoccus sp. Bi-70]|uniref:DUF429 domain-containing protein n=1 Tax=Tersicoccus sp. Bi-70 TaxID=1897634 RepID=UPI00097703EC|nr:DUF429 domain-containing protein [Tersicoccus sp. Bi-70]OMH34285.1 hypothetical protein BGP79_04005 [Tersicoccus sp. Bi-70]